ncbi:unnamed protein product [Phytomonas sp. Hart1]|nr:unnamed protein product [Phytomonas sp. Hart1]|eukprot:CCW68464.1 unnamed protein product [Phytomonas sp. isolate Hart1]
MSLVDQLAIVEDIMPPKRQLSISSVDSEPIKLCKRKGTQTPSVAESEEGRKDSPQVGARLPVEADIGISCQETTVPIECVSEAPVAVLYSVSQSSCICVAERIKEALVMDVGTRFCLSDGTFVGVLASVMGPVSSTFYQVASTAHQFSQLKEHPEGLSEGTPLHCDVVHRHVIFDLLTQCDITQGTDASYIDDEELPDHVRPDFSDDEKEKTWKRQHRAGSAAEAESPCSSSSSALDNMPWPQSDGFGTLSVSTSRPLAQSKDHLVVPAWLR